MSVKRKCDFVTPEEYTEYLGMAPIFSYDDLKVRVRKYPGFYRGFLSYELGYQFLGIAPREKPGLLVPEVFFETFKPSWEKPSEKKIIPSTHFLPFLSPRAIAFGYSYPVYLKKFNIIQEKLRSGETYQVNFAQPFLFSVGPDFSAPNFFRMLVTLNPSPHQFFLENEDFAVISNSPELLVRGFWEGKKFFLETRPIKGTVPRGHNETEDEANIRALLHSKKEEAELTMIVDLMRNDLGKVCKTGTIRVLKHRKIEKYSHVIHTVSVIRGELEEGKDVFDVLEALFPGGSVTGCPKKRTMEIIDELEDVRRGVYCGSAGSIQKDGSFEFNIMIRTAFLDKQNRILSFFGGGGIVVDSLPKREYDETFHKAAALFEALTAGERGSNSKFRETHHRISKEGPVLF